MKRLLLLGALALASGARADSGLTATAQLAPDPVGLGELVSLTLEVSSSGFSGIDATPSFDLDNLEIAGGPFRSQSQRWVNGETSSSLELTWRLRPLAEGKARVRAIRLAARGETLEVADQEIDVVRSAPARSQPPPRARSFDPFDDFLERSFPSRRNAAREVERPKVFLRAEITPAHVVAGQQATYTLWLYTQTDVGGFQPTRMPDFKGFWVREVPQPDPLRPEWVTEDGERLGRVPMLRRALFPLTPGHFRFDPTEADLVVRFADLGPFGSPFGRSETLHLRTDPVELGVGALPVAPAGFTGLVGEVTLGAKLDRDALRVGEAATLTLQASGRGHLQSLAPPALQLPEGLRTFPPKQEESERFDGSTLVATRTWSYVLVPSRSGGFDLPPVAMSYFDPGSHEFRKSASPPLALAVSPAIGSGGTRTAETTPDESPAAPSSTDTSTIFAPRAWPWFAGAGGLLLGAAAIAWRARGRSGAASDSSRALRTAMHVAETASPTAAREGAARLEEAWRQHLAARFQVAPSTPVTQWEERLGELRVEGSVARELVELAHELHYLRYAPELADPAPLIADALARSRRLARSLR